VPSTADSDAGLSIGVIVPDLSVSGGAERLALQCVARWQHRHRVTLYSIGFDRRVLAEFGIDVPCRKLPRSLSGNPYPGPEGRLVDALVAPLIWDTEIDTHDVYLGHQWRSLRFERAPFVWYAHETDRHAYDLLRERDDQTARHEMESLFDTRMRVSPDLRYGILQQAMRALDGGIAPGRVVANSRFTAAELERTLGLDGVRVVYPGVDADAFDEPRFDEPFFLSVGSLAAHKRHRLAVEALALVPDARLVIVGRGRKGPALERMATRLGVADRLELRSDVADDELRGLYAACRGVVFTPLNEPFGMVALEALAAGKPLVAVDRGGFGELVDASCAMRVPPEPPAIAAALQLLLDRPEEARRLGEAGRKIARAWSWDRTAAELEAILIEAAREAPTAAPRAAPAPARPAIGVRLVLDYGEGAAEGHWREPGATDEMPRAGHYAGHHESTLRRQLAEIAHGGFDFVLLSLWLDDRRLSPHGALALRHAVELAPELGPAARFSVELVADHPTPTGLAASLDWIAALLRGREAAFGVDGRPLVLLRGATRAARGAACAAARGATCAAHPELDVRPAPEPGGRDALRAASLARNPDLGRALDAALAAPTPAAVIVSSWNDYPEGEFLEPTVREGDLRLEAARAALARR